MIYNLRMEYGTIATIVCQDGYFRRDTVGIRNKNFKHHTTDYWCELNVFDVN